MLENKLNKQFERLRQRDVFFETAKIFQGLAKKEERYHQSKTERIFKNSTIQITMKRLHCIEFDLVSRVFYRNKGSVDIVPQNKEIEKVVLEFFKKNDFFKVKLNQVKFDLKN